MNQLPARVPTFVFKVFTSAEWKQFQLSGRFSGSDDDRRDGFIHLSTQEQLVGTLKKHFADEPDLIIAAIEGERLLPDLKMEESRGGGLFPHLYRPLVRDEIDRSFQPSELQSLSEL